MNRIRLLCLAFALGLPVGAQESRPSGQVNGVVFDSVAMAPLSGATVQLALVDSMSRAAGVRVVTATTDARGRFAFDSVPSGRYGIGFQHPALTALGLDAPLRAFRLDEGARVSIDLVIPRGPQVRALTCGGSPSDASDGLLAGYVTNAVRGTPLTGATVSAHWTELGVVEKKFRAVPRDLVANANEDGAFQLCGVVTDAPVQITVARAGFRSLATEIVLPSGGALRHDIRLVDTSVARGTAAINGRATHDDGSAVSSGTIILTELGIEAPVRDGAFTLSGLPAGTWSLEARVIGYEPQTLLVDAVEGTPANVAVKLANKIQVLDAVTVFGKVGGDMKVVAGIVERRRTAFGTVFLPGNEWLASALYPADIIQSARGFRYLSMDSVVARGCTEATSIMGLGGRHLVLYLDGARFSGDLSDLTNSLNVRDILAVEAYPDAQSIPALWRSMDACALIAFWTKRP